MKVYIAIASSILLGLFLRQFNERHQKRNPGKRFYSCECNELPVESQEEFVLHPNINT
jgi:hypothetical protein